MTGCGVVWSHCFDTVETACPRLGTIPASYIINEPNTEAVDEAGCCCSAGRAGGTVGFLCIHSKGKQTGLFGAERLRVGRALCVCSSQHCNYLENLAASSADSAGHMVKVIACWQPCMCYRV